MNASTTSEAHAEIIAAVATLDASERGRATLRALRDLFAIGNLDSQNRRAVQTLVAHALKDFPDTVQTEIRSRVGYSINANQR